MGTPSPPANDQETKKGDETAASDSDDWLDIDDTPALSAPRSADAADGLEPPSWEVFGCVQQDTATAMTCRL